MISAADIFVGILLGFTLYFIARCLIGGLYTVDQNERAIKTSFGRAERLLDEAGNEISVEVSEEGDRERYLYPQVRVIGPGGPYFKLPWEKIHKVSVATETNSIAFDPISPSANQNGKILAAVTKDQLNTGLQGQIRYAISEQNLYAYLFGIKEPMAHIMGFFTSLLRERIANFEVPHTDASSSHIQGISINDLRKNLRDLNDHMEKESRCSVWRYGIRLDAALITEIDPPPEVESALAAINTAHNQVSAEISLAQASADQKIVQSKRAVEIETLKAQAEVEPLRWLASQLTELKKNGPAALPAYLRNIRLALYGKARRIILEAKA